MENLIKKYNKECNYTSKMVNRIWQIGQILILIIFEIFYIKYQMFIKVFALAIIFAIILYFICECLESIIIANKLKIKYNLKEIIFKRKTRKEIYNSLDKFQKDWITCYCKKNKINTVEKLKIIREELQEKQNDKIIKYIDPIIIWTLSLTIWDILVDKITEEVGIINGVLVCAFITIIISTIIGWIKKSGKNRKSL